MKILISPAKSLDFDTPSPTSEYSNSSFLEYSKTLNSELKKLSSQQLAKLMKLSNNLSELNNERNHAWKLPFSPKNAKQAVYAFTGDVYKGLDANSISKEKKTILQEKLRILSGLYGILKPLDLIQPYRLEMGTKLPINDAKNLYDFWGEILVNALNEEMKEDELLINLASNEYFKVIPKNKIKSQLITPIFKEQKGEQFKVIAIYAKKARGLMVRYIIDNDVETLDELKGFDVENYGFSESLSSKNELVFVR